MPTFVFSVLHVTDMHLNENPLTVIIDLTEFIFKLLLAADLPLVLRTVSEYILHSQECWALLSLGLGSSSCFLLVGAVQGSLIEMLACWEVLFCVTGHLS